jgi:hypothetical protein
MRLFSVLALLAGLCFALAGPVRAGDFGAPVNSAACGEADVDGDAMPDPASAFIFAETPELCAKLCDRAGKLCRVYVNDVFACYLRVYANIRSFGKLNCESIYDARADEKICKESLDDAVDEENALIKGERDAERENCLSWRDSCRAACAL